MKSLLATTLMLCFTAVALAAEPDDVAAKVGSDTISVAEVEHEMQKALQDREVEAEDEEVLLAQTLGLLVNRQLVIQFLKKTKLGASKEDLDLSLERITAQLKRRELTLADQLKQLGLTEPEFRRALEWESGWPKYLALKLTPENIRKYFDQHHREFDGTKLRVAHLLLKVDDPASEEAVEKTIDRAGELRAEIASGKTTFAEAAKKHSQAPTAADGGDIGLITRHEPMPEPFSEAAFELEPGDTSEPVLTTFGVHLVHCLEIVPGKLKLTDDGVEDAVREDLIRYLFMWVAEKQRQESRIEFTGALPYFDPATGKLVKAKQPGQERG